MISILSSRSELSAVDLPSYDGVEEVVLNGEVVEGRAKPLLSYADRRGDVGTSA